jgi:hypothetical protein
VQPSSCHFDRDSRAQDREEVGDKCPVCGGRLIEHEITGTEYIDGPVRWIGLNFYCENEDWQWLIARA